MRVLEGRHSNSELLENFISTPLLIPNSQRTVLRKKIEVENQDNVSDQKQGGV